MATYSSLAKPAAWVLLAVTLSLAFTVSFAVGFVYVIVGFIQHFMVPEKPWVVTRALWLTAAILVPALFLARFYFVIAVNTYSPRYASAGWIASAGYHASLTFFFVLYMPGTVSFSDRPGQFPLAAISGAACVASLYLRARYPRPPRLPTNDRTSAGAL